MRQTRKAAAVVGSLLAVLLIGSCASHPQTTGSTRGLPSRQLDELDVQARVMEMADDYIASLGEAIYLVAAEARNDPRARWLTASFLRNGVGASIDIATGPNPDVALLDLLVLASLQTWAFEKHWIPAGIDQPTGARTVERLRQAERELWRMARHVLNNEQEQDLRDIIADWIDANPDRTVVAFVRFDDFTDARRLPSGASRRRASGLLKELSEATARVEDATLLGERVIWFAGRYPYVLGEQTELTAYRLADQPEVRKIVAGFDAIGQLSDTVAHQIDTLPEDLRRERELLFRKVQAERNEAIRQAAASLQSAAGATVDLTFDRLADERTALFDDLEARQGQLASVFDQMRQTIEASTRLADELTQTVDAVDRVVARFDYAPGDTTEPLDVKDIRDAAVEAANAAERLTTLLDRTHETLLSDEFAQRFGDVQRMTGGLVDRAFYRALILVAVMLAGLAVLRRIPQRPTRTPR